MKKFLKDAESFTAQEADGIPYETNLQLGAIYFISTNIDVSDGLYNGATGYLRKIDCGYNNAGVKVPTIAWMEFQHPLIGASLRERSKLRIQHSNANEMWTPISRISREVSKSRKYPGMKLLRKQIPLVAANAMTIAKVMISTWICKQSLKFVCFSVARIFDT